MKSKWVIVGMALVVLVALLATACAKPAPSPSPTPTPTPAPTPSPTPTPKPTPTPSPTPTPKPTPKLEEQPITWGAEACWTGIAAEKCNPMERGEECCIEYINKEKGGILGHPIKVKALDSGYDSAKMVTLIKRWIDEGQPLFCTHSSKMMEAAMGISNRVGMPGIVDFASLRCIHPQVHSPTQARLHEWPGLWGSNAGIPQMVQGKRVEGNPSSQSSHAWAQQPNRLRAEDGA